MPNNLNMSQFMTTAMRNSLLDNNGQIDPIKIAFAINSRGSVYTNVRIHIFDKHNPAPSSDYSDKQFVIPQTFDLETTADILTIGNIGEIFSIEDTFRRFDISATGQYITMPISNYQNTNSTEGLWVSADYGVNWNHIPLSGEGDYKSAVISANGERQIVIKQGLPLSSKDTFQISSNFGQTFAPNPELPYVLSAGISSTGKYMYICTYTSSDNRNKMMYSHDYGATWAEEIPTIPLESWMEKTYIHVSDTGQYAITDTAGSTAAVFTSSDYGVTWIFKTSFSFKSSEPSTLNCTAMSASGQYQYVCSQLQSGRDDNPVVYYSSDFGNTWILSEIPPVLTDETVMGITCSETTVVISTNTSQLFVSYNFGQTWALLRIDNFSGQKNKSFYTTKMSRSGEYIFTSNPGIAFQKIVTLIS